MDFFNAYFSCTQAQKHSSIVLILLISLLMIWPVLQAKVFGHSLDFADPNEVFKQQAYNCKTQACQPFEPALLTEKDWVRLGFNERIAQRIMRFQKRHALSQFSDLTCIYAIDTQLLKALRPCMVFKPWPPKRSKSVHQSSLIELNSADSFALEQLPFIGMKLAKRIVEYRARLGGFVALDQLLELYGLQQSQFDQMSRFLSLNPKLITQMAINQIEFDALRLHPYLTYTQAKIIVNYRTQHGPFIEANDLLKCLALDEIQLNKLLPYLKF